MSTPDFLAELRARYDDLLTGLDAAEESGRPATEREQLGKEIVDLFRETEGLLLRLIGFKEEIRILVGKFKALPVPAPQPSRVDHLGSSTYLERGWSAIAGGEYEQAVRALRRAMEFAPGEPAAQVLLGWALMLRAEYDEALGLFQQVLARDPGNQIAWANLGYICLKKGIFGEAIEHLSRVLRTDSDRKATLYANFYMGLLYLEREMYTDSKSFFARALEAGPNLIEAWWELGRACYLEGNTEEAVTAWRKGMQANRFSIWGDRCARALVRMEAGEAVSFG
ncbi:hypothetical protein BH23GEM3_BH23GEM3_04700 [soil metagenome]